MGSIGSLSELRAALWRQAWLIIIIILVGLPSVYVYAKTRPRVYEATGVIGVEVSQEALVAPAASSPQLRMSDRLDELQRLLLSRERALEIAERHNLFPGAESTTIRLALTRGAVVFNRLMDPSQFGRPDPQPHGLAISVQLEDAAQAMALANELLQTAVEEETRLEQARLAANLERMNELLGFLRTEETRVGEEIDTVEAEIAEFRRVNAASLPESLPETRAELSGLEAQRSSLEAEIAVLDRREQGQLTTSAAERYRAQLDDRLAEIVGAIERVELALEAAPEMERQLSALDRRLTTLEVELEAISMQRAQASMTQTLATGSQVAPLFILESAVLPEHPVSGSRRKIAMAGGVAVLGLALGLALARELLHPVIRTAAQMRRQLDITPVVVIPYVAPHRSIKKQVGIATGSLAVVLLLLWILPSGLIGSTPQAIYEMLEGTVPAWLSEEVR